MKRLTPVFAAVMALAPVSVAAAQAKGKDMAMDFRTVTSVVGSPDSTVVTGHVVSSGLKMRMDMAATGRSPTPFATDGPVSVVVSDSGTTVAYLDTKQKQYMILRPAEMRARVNEMGMKTAFSEPVVRVDTLGPGPIFLGAPSSHFRLTVDLMMTISGRGRQDSVRVVSVTEYYFPTNNKSAISPERASYRFAGMTGTDMLGMLGSDNKIADKMKAAESKLPQEPPLRVSNTVTLTGRGMAKVTKTDTEYSGARWVTVDPKVFEIPADYTQVQAPGSRVSPPPNP